MKKRATMSPVAATAAATPATAELSNPNEEPPQPPSGRPSHPLINALPFWQDVTAEQWNDWHWQYANRIRTMDQLAQLPGMSSERLFGFQRLLDTFRFSVTPYYLSLIDWNDPQDPILRQSIPDLMEIDFCMSDREDPLEEEKDMQVPGLVHRYPNRVLCVVTNLCAMYCRHCTRKRLWHEPEMERSMADLQRMVDYVAATPEVREVIVSGGDPLLMNLDKLDWFLGALEAIAHVEVLRIGTRVPVVLPMRITDELCAMLGRHRPLWLNTQFNHPREITPAVAQACDRLLRVGIPVSSQTVLLRGINDTVEVMRALLHGLERIMVRPYYLFQCDPVKGVEHFQTSIWTGIHIIEKLRGHTGGLCIPTYVIDAPGGGGKIPLQPFYLLSTNDREVMLRNYEGMILSYNNPQEADFLPKKRKKVHHLKQIGPMLPGGTYLLPDDSPRVQRRRRPKLSVVQSG